MFPFHLGLRLRELRSACAAEAQKEVEGDIKAQIRSARLQYTSYVSPVARKKNPRAANPLIEKTKRRTLKPRASFFFFFFFPSPFLFCFVLFVVVVLLTDKSVRPSVRPASSASIHSCVHAIDWLPNQDRGRRRREDDGGAVRSGRRRGGLRVG